MTAITIAGVDMVFNAGRPNEVRALQAIDLDIEAGQFVTITPNETATLKIY